MHDTLSSEALMFRHLIQLIKETIDSLPEDSQDDLLEQGRRLAYYEVACFVTECSRVFNVPMESLGFEYFDTNKII